jgi:pimeloyl-ACP methyl ester carboxylesterase
MDYEDAVAVLDHLGATSAYVVGQSRGGAIALDFVLAYPERADALIPVSGGIHGYEADLPAGTEPPGDEMERLWEDKDWPRSRSSRLGSGSTVGASHRAGSSRPSANRSWVGSSRTTLTRRTKARRGRSTHQQPSGFTSSRSRRSR